MLKSHQWSLAKQIGIKTWKMIIQKTKAKLKPEGMIWSIKKLQFL